MTDQTAPEPTEDDDEMPSVHFNLRNPEGTNSELELRQHMLGLELYVLVTPGEEGPTVEASHQNFDDLAGTLTFILGTLLQSSEVSDETREMAVDFIGAALEEA